jgi:hypothetical protein
MSYREVELADIDLDEDVIRESIERAIKNS